MKNSYERNRGKVGSKRPIRRRRPINRLEYSFHHIRSNRLRAVRNEIDSEEEESSSDSECSTIQCLNASKGKELGKIVLDSNLTFDCVKGLTEQINILKEMIIFPLIYPELFSKFELTPGRGILLHGPPGTGKTLLPKVMASELSRNGIEVSFFYRKGADCLSKWAGESERQLRLLFQEAHACRPAIIFFDEVDALAPIRSRHQDQIYCSLVSTLLALMDGFEQREQVLVIGATNRIESIDPAFRRPGRFDKELKFELPSESIRKEIIKMHVQKWSPPLGEEIISKLALCTTGYSGADLRALIGDAALRALKRTFPGVYQSTSQKINIDTGKIRITENDFTQSMKAMTPSTHRVRKELRMPLPPHIRPLLKADLLEISEKINSIFPMNSYRPRLVVCAKNALYGQTSYLAPAVLYGLENIPIHRFDSESLFSNTRGAIMEETGLNLLKESIKCLPSVLFIPHISKVWRTMSIALRDIFISFLSDISPTVPLFIFATCDESFTNLPSDLKDFFSEDRKEVFNLKAPDLEARQHFFDYILSFYPRINIRDKRQLKLDFVESTDGFLAEDLERAYNKLSRSLDFFKPPNMKTTWRKKWQHLVADALDA